MTYFKQVAQIRFSCYVQQVHSTSIACGTNGKIEENEWLQITIHRPSGKMWVNDFRILQQNLVKIFENTENVAC